MNPSIPAGRKPALHKLTPSQDRLVRLMQTMNFGRIEQLHIQAGEPVFEPRPQTVREIKFGGDNLPRRELDCADFILKGQVIELLEHFRVLGDAVVETLVVKHGLPFSMLLRAPATTAA